MAAKRRNLPPVSKRHLQVVKPADIKKIVKAIPQHFLICREDGHAWSPYTVDYEGAGFVRELICGRCGSFKIKHIDNRGRRTKKSHINYVEGYLIKGWGQMTMAERDRIRIALAESLLHNMPEWQELA